MIVAVVLAGGRSRRFGADKLAQLVDGRRLLDVTIRQLPAGTEVVVVGPETPGGPAAALVAGLGRALALNPDALVVLPGDAPQAGLAAAELLARLTGAGVEAVVAVDPDGREQPLQLALRPTAAQALIAAAGPSGAVDGSARALIAVLHATPHELSAAAVFDIDTPDQLRIWELRTSPAVEQILARLSRENSGKTAGSEAMGDATFPEFSGPVVVALDGPSGAGKSSLAAALALRTRCVVIACDDYVSSDLGSGSPPDWSDRETGERTFDWRRLRTEVLELLRIARLAPAGTLAAAPVVVLDSARPELADLVDLTVFVDLEL